MKAILAMMEQGKAFHPESITSRYPVDRARAQSVAGEAQKQSPAAGIGLAIESTQSCALTRIYVTKYITADGLRIRDPR